MPKENLNLHILSLMKKLVDPLISRDSQEIMTFFLIQKIIILVLKGVHLCAGGTSSAFSGILRE